MDWREIPSLSALRAFEAAARLGSYSQAARDPNVTHAAIAQHVRHLEGDLGHKLMERAGRGVVPTAAGQRLARHLASGFGDIADGVRDLLRERRDAPVSVTTTQSFAENWLMPRIGQFWAAHPGAAITVSVDNDVIDLARSKHHLAIRYGAGRWPGVDAEFLTDAQALIVGTPDLVARLPSGFDLASADHRALLSDLPWVADTQYLEFFPWLAAQGLAPERLNRTDFNSPSLVLAACRSGVGFSVQTAAVVERDIEDGKLVAISPRTDQTRLGYYIVRTGGPMPEAARLFARWLKQVR